MCNQNQIWSSILKIRSAILSSLGYNPKHVMTIKILLRETNNLAEVGDWNWCAKDHHDAKKSLFNCSTEYVINQQSNSVLVPLMFMSSYFHVAAILLGSMQYRKCSFYEEQQSIVNFGTHSVKISTDAAQILKKRDKTFFIRTAFPRIIYNNFKSVSLWRRANARNVRLYYPYWRYTDLFILQIL